MNGAARATNLHGVRCSAKLPRTTAGHHVLEWVRQKLFHLDGPMTEEDKARIKREVKIGGPDISLDEFRARRAAAGLLDPE